MPKRRSSCPDTSAPGSPAHPLLAILSRLLAAALLTGLALSGPLAAAPEPQSTPYVERPESDLLLLALRLNQTILADTLPAYPSGGSIVLPFGEVCRLLDFAIQVDVTRGTAEGFFIAENRRFFLDARAGKVVVEGVPKRFDPAGVEVHRDDIYVDPRLISQWLPLDFTVNLYASLVTVRPREPLPMQLRREREAQVQKDLASLGLGGPKYPPIENGYRLFDGPFLDQTTRLTWTPDAGGGHRAGVQASLLATGDLLAHEASAYVFASDRSGISDKRLSLGRKDPAAGLLGPLRAREYGVGEVLYPGLDLVSLPISGPGVLLSNFPLQRQTQFDRQTFRGELQPGWQVELYQNGALIAFQQSRPDGLYEFDNVPLLFGLNLFRLVFYGPFGQKREEHARFNVGESLTPSGRLYYRFVGNVPRVGVGRRGHLEMDYGLSSRLSVTGSYARVDLPDGRREYGRLGLRGFWDVLSAHADVVTDWRGGTLVNAGVQTRLGPLGLFAERAELSNFESEIFRPVFGLIRSRTTVRLDGTVPTSFLPAVPMTLEYKEDRLTTGLTVREINNRIATSYGGFAVSNFLTWTSFHGAGTTPPAVGIGDFLVGKFLREFALRGEVIYNLKPRTQFSNIALTAETRALPRYLIQAGVNRIVRARQTQYLASVTRAEGPFGLGVNLTYADRGGGLSAALIFNVSLARDPRGSWRMQARPLAAAGAASTFVFLDANGNGRYDRGEEPLEGVGFRVSRGAAAEKTGADGRAFLPNLPSYQDTGVGIALSTLEDPLAFPSREGVSFVPRAGKATVIDFPIVVSGEITGTVYVSRNGASQPGGGVELELIDGKGAVAKTARSAFDGFYDITGVAPGTYRLRASPAQMDRLGLLPPEPRELVMAPSGTILDGLDLVITAR